MISGKEEEVPVSSLAIGDLVRVSPADKSPPTERWSTARARSTKVFSPAKAAGDKNKAIR